MLQQDLALVADFSAPENLFFGRELSLFGFLRKVRMLERIGRCCHSLALRCRITQVPVRSYRVGNVSGGYRKSPGLG